MDTPDFSPIWKVGAAAIVAAGVLCTAAGYGLRSCERQRDQTEAAAIIATRAANQRASDSLYFFTLGQRFEVQRQLDSLSHHAEILPSAGSRIVLPVRPPRQ